MKNRAAAALITLSLGLSSCHSGPGKSVSVGSMTCESLAPEVIEMTKGKDPELLDLTNITDEGGHSSQVIYCSGGGEWSDGHSGTEFGAHTDANGMVILTVRKNQ